MNLITTLARGVMNLALLSLYGVKNLDTWLVSLRNVPKYSTLIRLEIMVLAMTTITPDTKNLIFVSLNSFSPSSFLDFLAFLGSFDLTFLSYSSATSLSYTFALTQKSLTITEYVGPFSMLM